MAFSAEYSKQAKKVLRDADRILAKRLLTKVGELQENPFPADVKRVEGYAEKIFRVRVGDYRILYEVDHQNNVVGIIKIDKRSQVY